MRFVCIHCLVIFILKKEKQLFFFFFVQVLSRKVNTTVLYLQTKALFSVAHSASIFIEVNRSWISPLLQPVSLCGQDFIYNKGVIYENLKALTTP